MAIEFECPECDRPYRVRDDLAGRRIPCKECGARMKVPDDGYDEYESAPRRGKKRPAGKRGSSGSKRKSKKNQKSSASNKAVGAVMMVVGGLIAILSIFFSLTDGIWIAAVGGGVGFTLLAAGQKMVRG